MHSGIHHGTDADGNVGSDHWDTPLLAQPLDKLHLKLQGTHGHCLHALPTFPTFRGTDHLHQLPHSVTCLKRPIDFPQLSIPSQSVALDPLDASCSFQECPHPNDDRCSPQHIHVRSTRTFHLVLLRSFPILERGIINNLRCLPNPTVRSTRSGPGAIWKQP